MAFNLNKNDGSIQDSSGKTPTTSKFDLSKGDAESVTETDKPSSSKTWIIVLVGILIIGAGIWYYSSAIKTADSAHAASTEIATSDSSAKVAPASDVKKQSKVEPTDTGGTVASAQPIAEDPKAKNAIASPAKMASAGNINVVKTNLNNKVPVTFNQGSFSFRRIDQTLIKRIVYYLSKNPEASINVNGYASSDGSVEINQSISQARADAFKKYLVSKRIADSRVIARGKGSENPIASNDTKTGRSKNRRVEIVLP